jgi:hypothetical protein
VATGVGLGITGAIVGTGVAAVIIIFSGISESFRNILDSIWFIVSESRVGVSGSDISGSTAGAGFVVRDL